MHTFKSVAACLAIAQGIAASPADLETRQSASSCNEPLHLIVGGGNSLTLGNQNKNSRLQSLIDKIYAAIPGTTEFLPPYDGSADPLPAATIAYENAVRAYAASCPNVPIALIGYSFGGIVMMNTLCGGILPEYNRNIIAAVAYGEETQVAGQSYDVGNCTTSAPGTAIPVRSDPETCDPYAAKIHSYCLSTDPRRCKTGTDPANHFDYPMVYDPDAFEFIKEKYYERNYMQDGQDGWGNHAGHGHDGGYDGGFDGGHDGGHGGSWGHDSGRGWRA